MKDAEKSSDAKQENSLLLFAMFVGLCTVCVSSAVGVVYSTHESRQAVYELDRLKREASGMEVLSGQYLLEKSVWASYSRIEKIAKEELHMDIPQEDKTVLVYKK